MQRIKPRKVMATSAMLALALVGLAGCGNGGSGTQTPSASGNASNSASASTTEAVEISYLHRLPDDKGMTLVNDIVAKWNKDNPDIKVTATKFQGKASEMIKKLETDSKAGNAPCLAQLGYAEVPEMFTKGLLADVTEYAGQYKSHFGGSFDLMKVGDKYVGLPQDAGPLVYVYNKAEFDALGISVPTKVEDVFAAAEKAAAQGKYVLAFEPDEAQNWLSAQAAAAGDSWFSVKDDKWVVDTKGKGTQVVADMWQKLLDNKQVLVEQRWGDGFKAAIKDGKLIGTIAAAWEPALIAADFANDANVAGKWAVAQLWDFGSGAKTGPDGGSGVAVMKDCKYPEQAMKFNDWFNTQVADLATQGLVTAAKGKVETPEAQKAFFGGQDIYAEFETANTNLVPISYIPGFSTLGPAMSQAADGAAAGTGKVMDIFNAAQDSAVKALQDLKLPVAE